MSVLASAVLYNSCKDHFTSIQSHSASLDLLVYLPSCLGTPRFRRSLARIPGVADPVCQVATPCATPDLAERVFGYGTLDPA
jgi:hypothetical protein